MYYALSKGDASKIKPLKGIPLEDAYKFLLINNREVEEMKDRMKS